MKKKLHYQNILTKRTRAIKAEKSKKRFSRLRRNLNLNKRKNTKGKKKTLKLINHLAGFIIIIAPQNFSLINNPEKVIEFITKLKVQFDRGKKVFIEMEHIDNIDYSAIIILLSIMIRFKAEKILFNGNFPNTPEVKRVFLTSGFFKILGRKFIKNQDRYKFGEPNTIHTHAWKHVDPHLSHLIMEQISPFVSGKLGIYKGLHRVLIELMQNSFNHAQPGIEGDKHWWLSVNLEKENKVAKFSFVDYGVGIFESLNNKPSTSRWYNWRKRMKFINNESNAYILEKILNGELHKTVTGENFRGKGLPGIKETMDRNLISKLYIITNDVFANIKENKFITLNNNFQGTFVYWEIDESNILHPWIPLHIK